MSWQSRGLAKPYDFSKLDVLATLCADRIEEFLVTLEIEATQSSEGYRCACPVHDGDSPTAFRIVLGQDWPFKWQCFTHGCHKKYKTSVFGLVRGILENRQNREVRFKEALQWVENFVGRRYKDIASDDRTIARTLLDRQLGGLSTQRSSQPKGVARNALRSLKTPSPYFLGRGFSSSVLKSYGVGDCQESGKPMTARAVVPVFDESGDRIIGCSGRTLYPQCPNCQFYHAAHWHCPTNYIEEVMGCKWRHCSVGGADFEASKTLYNFWSAKDAIRKDGVAILVEGPADVWRLEEASIPYGLGLFGTSLSDGQQIILEQSGATSIVILTDEDEAGRKAADQLNEQLRRLYRLYFPRLTNHDIGDTPIATLRERLVPLLDQIKREFR